MEWLAANPIWIPIAASALAIMAIYYFILAARLLMRSSKEYFEVHENYADENFQKLTYLRLDTLKSFRLLLRACLFLAPASVLLGAYKQNYFYIMFGCLALVLSLFLWLQEKKYIKTLRKELGQKEPQ